MRKENRISFVNRYAAIEKPKALKEKISLNISVSTPMPYVTGKTADLEYGEIGAFAFHNEAYIKEYSRAGLRSLNKKYKMMRFNDEDSVLIIGRVLGVLPADAIVDFETVKRYERIRKAMAETEE